jgi:DNA replication and repair protein RecF
MRLRWLELRDFRNHAHTHLDDIPEGLIVVVAPNGEGKTNLLEGMHVLYATSSPRTSASEPLVRHGADVGYARGEFEGREGKTLVEIEVRRRGANRIHVNRSPVRRRRDLRRVVRAVLFGPFDLPIVIGEPGRRRDFLDEAVVALSPAQDTLTSTYEKVLRQRNRLLKEWDGTGAPAGIDAWDEQLVGTGAAVIRARARAAERLATPAGAVFAQVAGYGLIVRYLPNVPPDGDIEADFRAALAARRDDERQRRTSLVGPHRDDLDLAVRDLGARAFGSHGETWAATLSLRLGLAEAVADEIGEQPLLLVDDPFSALDPARRDRIAARLAERGGQVVITVADEADVSPLASAVWEVRAGSVRPRAVDRGGA